MKAVPADTLKRIVEACIMEGEPLSAVDLLKHIDKMEMDMEPVKGEDKEEWSG